MLLGSEKLPHLDTRNLTEQQMEDLKVRLLVESKDIQRKFGSLVCKTEKALETSMVQITIDNLRSFLETSECERVAKCIKDNDTIPEVMRRITRSGCWSFFNPELLQSLIDTYCSGKQVANDYRAYLSEFREYCKRRLYEVPASVFPPTDDDSSPRIVVKLDVKFDVPLLQIKEIQFRLSKICGVELKLIRIRNGCIELTFSYFSKKGIIKQEETELEKIGVKSLHYGTHEVNENETFTEKKSYSSLKMSEYGLLEEQQPYKVCTVDSLKVS